MRLVLTSLLVVLATAPARAQAPDPRAWPGDSRAALVLPDPLWRDVLPQVGHADRAFGYRAEEMKFYGRDAHLLRTVDNLFRDARHLPRFGGKLSDDLLAAAAPDKPSVAELLRVGFALVDVSAARMLAGPTGDDWGHVAIPRGATPDEAFAILLGPRHALDAFDTSRWRALPLELRRLVVRLLVAAEVAKPSIHRTWSDPRMNALLRDTNFDERYRLATAPWTDDELGQQATRSAASLDALALFDRDDLGHGALVHALWVDAALAEWRAFAATPEGARAVAAVPAQTLRLVTPRGPVKILGPGDDADLVPAYLTVDVGGNDRHEGRHGVPWSLGAPFGLLVDLGGDDTYDAAGEPCALGCGLFGVGAIVDLDGDDTWTARESSQAAAWYGAGWILDAEGSDRYRMDEAWGQAAAHVGVALLADLGGDDTYDCAQQAQGLGSTLGAGLLVDVAGDDLYLARDDGNVESIYLYQSVAMAQGCGYGRRADLGDGHSLAGGFGVLVDGAGDDRYQSQVWSQGAGYWWAAGILEDRSGDDVYCNGKYSSGTAAHFGVGVHVDAAGDDLYNVGNDTAVNQYQGHARDGSIGVFVDGDGDDRYLLRHHCMGSADLGSLALAWDRRGDDAYEVRPNDMGPPNGWNETAPLGSATWYPPFRNFRDDLPTAGVFLDTGGRDAYLPPARGRDGTRWTFRHEPASHGLGLDLEWWMDPEPPRSK